MIDEITFAYGTDTLKYNIKYLLDANSNYDSPPAETYDDNENGSTYKKDLDNDGTFEYVLKEEHEGLNYETREYIDFDDDGVFDRFNAVYFTNEDNISKEIYYRDGELRRAYESEYDDNGNVIRSSKDHDGDGEFDKETFSVFDENDNLIIHSIDNNGDGTMDSESHYAYTYDDAGNWISYEKDFDADGIFDELFSYTYDDAGNQTSYKREIDSNDDGQIDYSQTRQYNAEGDVVLIGTYGSDNQSGYDIA